MNYLSFVSRLSLFFLVISSSLALAQTSIGTDITTQNITINGNSVFSGNVGIGTSSPSQKLHVNGISVSNAWDTSGTLNIWQPEKHPSNPVICGTTGDTDQSYPPSVIKVDGTYYGVMKSGGTIYGFSSPDGVNWTQQGVVMSKLGTWDSSKLEYSLLRYDPDTSTYHLYFSGVGTYTQAIGHATSSSPLSGYVRDVTDPLYIPSDWTADINKTGYEADAVYITDIIYYDDQYIFYGVATLTDGRNIIWAGTGNDWDDINATHIIFDEYEIDLGRDVTLLQTPSVIRYQNTFIMQFTAGINNDQANERSLFSAYGGPFQFTPVDGKVLEVGASDTWEDRRVYAAQWLKEQDGTYLDPEMVSGKVRLYYSGHTVAGNPSENQGCTGLAEFSNIPYVPGMAHAKNNLLYPYITVDETDNSVLFNSLNNNYAKLTFGKQGASSTNEHAYAIGTLSGSLNGHLRLQPSTGLVQLFNGVDDYDLLIYNGSDLKIRLDSNGDSYFNGGNLGVGVTSPSYRLELPNNADATGQGRANAWQTYSDQTLKENVFPLENSLEKIMNLKGVSFSWKGSGLLSSGFIAQEVESVIPDLVSTGRDGLKSLDYGRVTPYLVNALQEQQNQIQLLKTENTSFKQTLCEMGQLQWCQ